MNDPARRDEPLVLLVEDDPKVARTVALYAEHQGYRVQHCRDGARALPAFEAGPPDVVILDLGLPKMDGREVCRRIRAVSDVPIIMLTARTTEDDVIGGLDLGADDYVPKPFSPRQLMARVRAVLRRTLPDGSDKLRFEGVTIDPSTREATIGARTVPLTATQFDLLLTLASAPGRVYSRAELVLRVLGDEFDGSERTIDAHVKNLRHRLGSDDDSPPIVETVVGVGYRFTRRRLTGRS